jgi:SAM-dependent methyltransferase
MNKQMHRKKQPQSAAEAHTEGNSIDPAESAHASSTTGPIDAATHILSSCIASNTVQPTCNISAQQLHWSPFSNAAQVDTLTHSATTCFDVVIASDCLFFRDFHADLLETLKCVLRPGGVGVFLQPPRDGTMQRFVSLCVQSGYFSTELREDYNPEVRCSGSASSCDFSDAISDLLFVLATFCTVVDVVDVVEVVEVCLCVTQPCGHCCNAPL